MGESNADFIGDDSTPTLTFKNSSSGNALYVDGTAGTGIGLNVLGKAATEGALLGNQPTGGATIAPLRVAASVASQAVLSVSGVFMSTASVAVTAATSAFIIPVYHESQKVWGYITASKGVV